MRKLRDHFRQRSAAIPIGGAPPASPEAANAMAAALAEGRIPDKYETGEPDPRLDRMIEDIERA